MMEKSRIEKIVIQSKNPQIGFTDGLQKNRSKGFLSLFEKNIALSQYIH